MRPVLVSACLLGIHCRYDGGERLDDELGERLKREGCGAVPVCPEQLGGLPTPRPPSEITRGDGTAVLAGEAKVLAADGSDVTEQYLRGARQALCLAQRLGCRRAYLKEKSPACGVEWIRRGERTCRGRGVAAALLESAGIEVFGVQPPAGGVEPARAGGVVPPAGGGD